MTMSSKDALAQAARDQDGISFQETLAFLDGVRAEMETLGLWKRWD